MSKLTETLTLADVAQLAELAEEWTENELIMLMNQDIEYRLLQTKHGRYGRVANAEMWLVEIQRVVVAEKDVPLIKLPDHVVVALYDAYIDLP